MSLCSQAGLSYISGQRMWNGTWRTMAVRYADGTAVEMMLQQLMAWGNLEALPTPRKC